MKLLAVLLLVSAATLAPLAAATTDLPVCMGYTDCHERTGNGFAILCVQAKSGRWTCMECEACGNGPDLRVEGLPALP